MVSNQTTTATNNPYNLCHCVNKLLLTHKPVKGAIQSHPNFPAQLMQNISSMAAFQHQQYQLAAHLRTNRATTRQNKRHQPLPNQNSRGETSTWTLSTSWSSWSATGTAPAEARGAPAEGRGIMAVGGARGIAVGADAAGVVAGCGGSNPDTSQDQVRRESAIGAAATGNPRSRQENEPRFCNEEMREEEEKEVVVEVAMAVAVDGGSRPAPAPILSIASRGRGRRTGARNFSAFAFQFVASPCCVGPPRLWGRGGTVESFLASVSVRFRVWFEIEGPTGHGGGTQLLRKSEVVMGVTAGRTRVSLNLYYLLRR